MVLHSMVTYIHTYVRTCNCLKTQAIMRFHYFMHMKIGYSRLYHSWQTRMPSRLNIGLEYTEGASTPDIRMVYETTREMDLLLQAGMTTLNAYTTFIPT